MYCNRIEVYFPINNYHTLISMNRSGDILVARHDRKKTPTSQGLRIHFPKKGLIKYVSLFWSCLKTDMPSAGPPAAVQHPQ
jgi:hypothetical protein